MPTSVKLHIKYNRYYTIIKAFMLILTPVTDKEPYNADWLRPRALPKYARNK